MRCACAERVETLHPAAGLIAKRMENPDERRAKNEERLRGLKKGADATYAGCLVLEQGPEIAGFRSCPAEPGCRVWGR